jgi:thermitase
MTKKLASSFLRIFVFLAVLAIGTSAFSAQAQVPSRVQVLPVLSQNYIVQLNDSNIDEFANLPQIENFRKVFISSAPAFANVYQFDSVLALDQLQKIFAGKNQYLEVNHRLSAGAVDAFYPNDPGFTKNPENIDRQWGLLKANFPEAWTKTTGSRNVTVAVIDTGVDATHEDLQSTHFKTGYNVLTGKSLSTTKNSDDNGHGTLITGVIAAATDNNLGIAGAAFNVSIMPIKALDSAGSGSSSAIAQAIIWAADHDADVINLSLGGIGFAHDTTLANAITYAYNKNVVIVAAAGNDVAVTGGNLDKDPVFPICDDNGKNMIIGVTATDVNDLKPTFANFGKACVDVSAPGKRILSTINHDPATGGDSPDSYAYASGTSLAVPLVVAQAALLRSLYPNASNGQIRDRILATADNIDNLNLSQCAGLSCKGLLGAGRINVAKSLQEQIASLTDGDVVQVLGTDNFYYINGGKKQFIIPFVRNQRFAFSTIKTVSPAELTNFPDGSFAEPLNGTLIKSANDPAVYLMQNGLRNPVTYQVFTMRGLHFSDVVTLTNVEVDSWVLGNFLAPPDGTLIRSATNQTVYWVVNGTIHPINYKFYTDRGLNIFPVIYTSDKDIAKFPKGDPYIL